MKLPNKFNDRGIVRILPVLVIVATVGIISFILLTSTAPLSTGLFSKLFPKQASNAQNSVRPADFSKKTILIKLRSPAQNLKIRSGLSAQAVNFDQNPVAAGDLDDQALPPSIQEIRKNYSLKAIDKIFKKALPPAQELIRIKQNFKNEIAQKKRIINETELSKIDLSNAFKLEFDNDVPVEQIIQNLRQDPAIETAEEDIIFQASQVFTTPNDPYYLDSFPQSQPNRDLNWNPNFDYQWNLKKIGMAQVWSRVSGLPQVLVGVVDSGVDYTHPEFGSCSLAQVNNNQCAKVAPGFDYVNNDNDANDDFGHGTHVAGIIAAGANNGIGVAGMAPNARIIPLKGLSNTGSGPLSALASGIHFATDNGARVINASWVASGTSTVMSDAVAYAYNLGVVFAAASGNSNADASGFLPGNITCATPSLPGIDCTLTVAATEETDQKASYSNFGSIIDVAAPGGSTGTVLAPKSAVLATTFDQGIVGQNYLRLSGTSMATPHVAALAAIMMGTNPVLTPNQVRALILANSDDLGITGFDTTYGNGRINVSKVLTAMGVATPAPTPTPVPTPPSFGLSISPSSVNISIAQNSSGIALTITASRANSFSLIGSPTSFGAGINWSPSSSSIVAGFSRPILISVGSTVPLGTYQGTGVLQNDQSTQITFPVSVTVTPPITPAPTPTPVPTPIPTPIPTPNACQGADIDRSGKVDIFDYNIIVTNFGQTGTGIAGDIDQSGRVDIFDYNTLVTNFGKTGC